MRKKFMSTNKYRKVKSENRELMNMLDEKRNKIVNFHAIPNSIAIHKEMYEQCEWVYNNIKDKDRLVRCPHFIHFNSDDLLKQLMSLSIIAFHLEKIEEEYQYQYPVFIDSDGCFFNLNLINLWIDDIYIELDRRECNQ